MEDSKKGISLIVLVITIIVIIILAAAVILTLNNNNPIANARVAVDKSDYLEAQDAFTLWIQKVMTAQLDSVTFYGKITDKAPTATGTIKVALGTAGDGITPAASTLLKAINIDKLGLPSKITELYIKDNRVVGMVKNNVKSTYDYNTCKVTTGSLPDTNPGSGVTTIDPMA